MKEYRIRYDATKNYGFSYENIKARGLVHASKLAKSHMIDLRKIFNNPSIKVGSITQREEET